MKIYGISEGGNTVLVNVKGYYPYFYIPFPKELGQTGEEIEALRVAWNIMLKASSFLKKELIAKLEKVERTSLIGFQANPSTYLKVSVFHCDFKETVIQSLPSQIQGIALSN